MLYFCCRNAICAMRLDVFLVNNRFFASRELAKFNIAKGNVLVNGTTASKPSMNIREEDVVTLVVNNINPYVSRGGLKLEKAIKEFEISCSGITALDIGASTGGFTDCLLLHGASLVCAVDVGTNQLDVKLRDNPKVISVENKNIKDLSPDELNPSTYDLIVTDLSFISLTKVIGLFPKFLNEEGRVIALIKPQFEVGPELVGKGGIVKDKRAHIMAIQRVVQVARDKGLHLSKITWAPLHQENKNIEYLALFKKSETIVPEFKDIVQKAFKTF